MSPDSRSSSVTIVAIMTCESSSTSDRNSAVTFGVDRTTILIQHPWCSSMPSPSAVFTAHACGAAAAFAAERSYIGATACDGSSRHDSSAGARVPSDDVSPESRCGAVRHRVHATGRTRAPNDPQRAAPHGALADARAYAALEQSDTTARADRRRQHRASRICPAVRWAEIVRTLASYCQQPPWQTQRIGGPDRTRRSSASTAQRASFAYVTLARRSRDADRRTGNLEPTADASMRSRRDADGAQ